MVIYALTITYLNLINDRNSIWYWVMIALLGIWVLTVLWFMYKFRWRNLPIPKWKPWQRYIFVLLIVALLAFMEYLVYSVAAGHSAQLPPLNIVAFWSLAIVIDAIEGYLFNTTGKDLENRRMKIILGISLALAIFIIFIILAPLTGIYPWIWDNP